VRLVHGAQYSGRAERQVEKKTWISLATGRSLPTASLLVTGVLDVFAF
jgi:hypothetical protein